jgi:hypothetical protein
MSTQNDSYKNTTQQEVRATLKKIIEARKKEIKTLNESISKISKTINTNILEIMSLQKFNSDFAGTNNFATEEIIAANKRRIEVLKQTNKDLNNQLAIKRGRLSYLNNPSGASTATTPAVTNDGSRVTTSTNGGGANDWKKGYKYNAPMVKSAYFQSNKGISQSLQGKSTQGNNLHIGAWNDGKEAWRGTKGGRGVIQMDRESISTIREAQEQSIIKLDNNMYGFKFLYNPKEVGMAWGIMDQMDPTYVASGQDAFQVISAGLMSSSVTIQLILNRIEDMSYLDADGNYNTATSPYPGTEVPLKDRKEIYEKGTMYDIEYLFKTLNGPRGEFLSEINGTTADRGWLRPSIVELHLGARMRYRVRVQSLAVSHTMFNTRMVPIFSSISLTVGRFNDGGAIQPEGVGSATARNSYGNGGGGYVGGTWLNAEDWAEWQKKSGK